MVADQSADGWERNASHRPISTRPSGVRHERSRDAVLTPAWAEGPLGETGVVSDMPDDLTLYTEALRAAAQRIVPNRRSISREEAEDIVRDEYAARGLSILEPAVEAQARQLHRSPTWPLRHPIQARREGSRLGPSSPWSRGEWSVPDSVEALANKEAWRLTGSGVGPLASALNPAECKRLSRNTYSCAAEVGPDDEPLGRVEIHITRRRFGPPHLTKADLKML